MININYNDEYENKFKRKKSHKFLKLILFIIILYFGITYIWKPLSNSLFESRVTQSQSSQKSNTNREELNSKQELSTKANVTENWHLLLVNKDNPVPDNYKVNTIKYNDGYKTNYIDERIKTPLTDMFNAAKQNGLELCINSGYRSNNGQIKIFNDRIKKNISDGLSKEDAMTETLNYVAKPGTSEHETGLAVDIGFLGNSTWEKSYGWIEKNCSKYGFILRYPQNKKNITGVEHEPWHFRYVGKEAAKEIMESGLCLEEYLK